MGFDSINKFSDEMVQSLIELGRQTAGPQEVQKLPNNPVPFIIVNGAAKPLPELVFNEHSARPERIKTHVTVYDPESFCRYYRLFADDNSRVFSDEVQNRVTVVLDYHEARAEDAEDLVLPGPRWGQHRATLLLRHSPEWLRWLGLNNRQMSQEQFAEFLEQNSMDVCSPSAATMMEVARDLHGTTEVEFGGGVRTQDGQVQLKYTETTKATVGKGLISVPEKFVLFMPVFIGGPDVSMDALLRYRVKEGKLVIFFTLIRPEDVQRKAFLDARAQIAEALGVGIINGTPDGGR